MRILFTCGREAEYPRNAVLRACLEQNFEVFAITGNRSPLVTRYANLATRLLLSTQKHDLTFVGFLGQPIVPLVWMRYRKPIVFDAFLSVYDTLCFDRRYYSPKSLPGRLSFWLDYISCKLSNIVILDTKAHADYFQREFRIPKEKLKTIPVGCDENLFYPRTYTYNETNFSILFYGSFLPLQGIDVIIRAAKILEYDTRIKFRIIGNGIEYARIRRLANQIDVENVQFLPPVALSELPAEIARATVCLGGHFGTVEKARRVIASKTFQFLAMGKATIVGDNMANHEILTHAYDSWFCKMGDPEALADAILTLVYNPELRSYLGQNAYKTFMETASISVLSEQVRTIIERDIHIEQRI
jgi:glycosyltransferase involved in cell wall biosynthesis